jgi:hypothetical protein
MMNNVLMTFLAFPLLAVSCDTQKENPRIENVFLSENDSTKNYYTIVYPPEPSWKGYLFLIPGFGETAEDVFKQTDLPKELALNGILTIIPIFQDGVLSFGVDDSSQKTFHRILEDVTSKHQLVDQRFYVGGFSIGGSCSIKYAENSIVEPTAIFAIDPPLDFERFYNSAQRDLRLSSHKEANQESLYMIDRLEKETGGSPATNLAQYRELSPYSFSDTTQAAVKKLINMPLRIYSEPDINWWMNERGSDLTRMNITDCSAMINELNRLGNASATLITTSNKGFRQPDNQRHPHSWSIVDNEELIQWLLSQK